MYREGQTLYRAELKHYSSASLLINDDVSYSTKTVIEYIETKVLRVTPKGYWVDYVFHSDLFSFDDAEYEPPSKSFHRNSASYPKFHDTKEKALKDLLRRRSYRKKMLLNSVDRETKYIDLINDKLRGTDDQSPFD